MASQPKQEITVVDKIEKTEVAIDIGRPEYHPSQDKKGEAFKEAGPTPVNWTKGSLIGSGAYGSVYMGLTDTCVLLSRYRLIYQGRDRGDQRAQDPFSWQRSSRSQD